MISVMKRFKLHCFVCIFFHFSFYSPTKTLAEHSNVYFCCNPILSLVCCDHIKVNGFHRPLFIRHKKIKGLGRIVLHFSETFATHLPAFTTSSHPCTSRCTCLTPRDTSVLSRLRTVTPLPSLTPKRHCSFIICALNHYQVEVSN